MKETQVLIVGLYTYFNIPVRILHPLVDRMDGVKAHTIFYKNYDSNIFSLPSIREEEISGEHKIILVNEHDLLTISHKTLNRSVYSEGALLAAIWLDGNREIAGLYEMSDIYLPFEED